MQTKECDISWVLLDISQVFVLVPILFNSFVNDLDYGTQCIHSNTRLGGVADRPDFCAWLDVEMIQQELDDVQLREIPSPAPAKD